jgi:glucokinase
MFLGIEIGGTKLQFGVGRGDGSPFAVSRRCEIRIAEGAAGILQQIATVAPELIRLYPIERVGIGFGGPVDTATGCVRTSHQVAGWDGVPLVEWCHKQLDRPAVLGNDCDLAGLAEARFGAGQKHRIVFYVTVGTGIGGGLVIDGHLHGANRPAVAEIGHLRPGPEACSTKATVESLAAGPGLVNIARRRLAEPGVDARDAADFLACCGGDLQQLTAKQIGTLAQAGNRLALEVLEAGLRVLGWAVAQMITLTAAEVVVVGGGVSLLGETCFFAPLRRWTAQYVFPPLANAYLIHPAAMGEEVVVHGALAWAAGHSSSPRTSRPA